MAKQIIVLGLGEFGSCLARELYRRGCEVVAVDIDEDSVQDIADDVTQALIGDIRDEGFLKELGVDAFDLAVIGTSRSLETGILATVILKEQGCPRIIAKARTKLQGRTLKKVGADQVIYADENLALRLAQTISETKMLDLIHFSQEYSIAELPTPKSFLDKTVGELDLRKRYNVNIIALQHESGELDPLVRADTVIVPGDTLLLIGKNASLEQVNRLD